MLAGLTLSTPAAGFTPRREPGACCRVAFVPSPSAVILSVNCPLSLAENGSVSPAAYRPVIGAWYDNMYTKFQSWLGNERHMIQFGCIGMVIALFIIWWRKT